MKRGLKLERPREEAVHCGLAAESTPMKRGLKLGIPAGTLPEGWFGRREHPDEEGTETHDRAQPAARRAEPQRAPR